jgi:hypothetical protein
VPRNLVALAAVAPCSPQDLCLFFSVCAPCDGSQWVRVLAVPQPAAAAIADRETGQSCRLLWCSWPDVGCPVVPGTRCACLATVHSWWVCSHRTYVRVGCWRCSARSYRLSSPVCPCDGTGTYRSGHAWSCAVCYLCMGDLYPPRSVQPARMFRAARPVVAETSLATWCGSVAVSGLRGLASRGCGLG